MERPRDHNDLATALAEIRPAPRSEFAAELDARVVAGFRNPRQARHFSLTAIATRLSFFTPRRFALAGVGAGLVGIVITTVLITSNDSGPASVALDKSARDRLALALRDPQPNAAQADVAPTRSLTLTPTDVDFRGPSDDARQFRAQGLVALAGGDVAAARAFLERAADAGDARALMVLGDAYDPATLARLGAIGVKGDASRARDYYQRASDAGLAAARQRIAAIEVSQ